MDDNHPLVPAAACPNCSATLAGPYCAQCGQHAHESARSLHVLFHDAWHLFTHLDGRVWATLVPLMLRPGRLTLEYFADHRARYVPPFRLYFIISIAFFALGSLTTSLSNVATVQHASLSAEDRAELQQAQQEARIPAAVSGAVDLATTPTFDTQRAAQLCPRIATGLPRLDRRLQAICVHQLADRGKSMLHEFGSLVPKMMFVFLPLMALVMLALYHTPTRYYVEHLVFLLHVQSDLFLAMIVGMLLSAAASAWPLLDPVSSICHLVLFWYCVWYVYKALRRYYGQSRTRSVVKFVAIGISYLVGLGIASTGTLVLSALVT